MTVLGVDAGGTHTAVALASSNGELLARAEGPGAALHPGGAAASAAIILETARRAARQAKVNLPVSAVVVGAAGAGRAPEQEELVAALLASGVSRRARVMGDAELALATAFESGSGILLNAGTGSCAFARDAHGAQHRSGGYGWQLGDEGGGYWLGRRALAAAARAQDALGGGERTTLPARIVAALGLREFDDLIRWASAATPAQVASLAPHVLNAAGEGEMVARELVEKAARHLLELAQALERHFPGPDKIPVATMGGLLRPGSQVLAAVERLAAREMPRAELIARPIDPALGAVQLAKLVG